MPTTVLNSVHSRTTASEATRWGQLIFGIICMVMIANLQYGWTLFVNPIDQKYHWGRAAIQVAFTIFVLTETWLVPIEGYLIDKFGPRVMIGGSGALVAIAWAINSIADSLFLLYVGAAIGGIGAGVIYGGSVGNALKWFPDRRGLAAGLTAAGFGAGSALTVIPIANMIQSSGYQSAFLWFGLGQGIVVVLVALFLRAPKPGEVKAPAAPAVAQTKRDYGPAEVLRTPVFWVMYAMFVMVGAGGLMATAQLAPIAKDFNVGGIPVSILGITLPASVARSSVGCRTTSAARTRCSSHFWQRASASGFCTSMQATRSCSSSSQVSCSLRGVRSIACFRQRAPISTGAHSLRLTMVFSTLPKARHRSLCRSQMCCRWRPIAGR
jgi:OFA family oxalate/formate antiporter-like MFS transporter